MKTESQGSISNQAWLTLAILVLMLIVSYMDRGLISLMVQPIREDLGLSEVELSLLYGAAFGLFYATFSFPLGWLADRWSRRGVIFFCITFWSLATAGCGLATTFWQLAIARFAVGFGEAGLSPAAYRMLSDIFPRRRIGLALGLFGAGTAVASPLSMLIGGHLVDWSEARGGAHLPLVGQVEGWQLVFLVMGPPGVLLAPLIFLSGRAASSEGAESAPQASAGHDEMTLSEFVRTRWQYLTLLFLGFGCVALLSYGVSAWTPTALHRRFGLSMSEIGQGMAVATGLSIALCFIGGGWLTDRWFARGVEDAHFRFFVYSLPVVVLAGAIGFSMVDTPYAAFASLFFFYLAMPSSAPAAAHLQLATPVHLRSRVVALFLAAFNIIGLVLGPLTVALLTERVFADPAKIGLSLSITVFGGGILALAFFLAILRPARSVIQAAAQFAPADGGSIGPANALADRKVLQDLD